MKPVIYPDCGSDMGKHVCLTPRDEILTTPLTADEQREVDAEREFQTANDDWGELLSFVDCVSSEIWGGECAWERTGLPKLLGELRSRLRGKRDESAIAEQLTWQAKRIEELELELGKADIDGDQVARCRETQDDLLRSQKLVCALEEQVKNIEEERNRTERVLGVITKDRGDLINEVRKLDKLATSLRMELEDSETRCSQLRDAGCRVDVDAEHDLQRATDLLERWRSLHEAMRMVCIETDTLLRR